MSNVVMQYRIARNFWGRKLLQIGGKYDVCRENLLLLCWRMSHPQISQRKLLQIATKLTKVFSCESFRYVGYEQSMYCIFLTVRSRVIPSYPLDMTCFGQYQATVALLRWPGNVHTLLLLLSQAYPMCGTVAALRHILVEMNRTDAVNIIDRALMEDQGEPTLTMVTAKGATKPVPRPRIKTAPGMHVCACTCICVCVVCLESSEVVWHCRIMCVCVGIHPKKRKDGQWRAGGTLGMFVLSLLQCSAQRVWSLSLCWTLDWSPVPQKRLVREKNIQDWRFQSYHHTQGWCMQNTLDMFLTAPACL